MLEHDHFAWRVGEAFFDLGLLEESSHCVDLPDDCINVAVTAEFVEELLLVLYVLLRTSEFELLNYRRIT